MRVFVSYTRDDMNTATDVTRKLQAGAKAPTAGASSTSSGADPLTAWLDRKNILPAQFIHTRISYGLSLSFCLLLVLPAATTEGKPNFRREVVEEIARADERDLPIVILADERRLDENKDLIVANLPRVLQRLNKDRKLEVLPMLRGRPPIRM